MESNKCAERNILKQSHYSALDGVRPRKSWRPSVRAKIPNFFHYLPRETMARRGQEKNNNFKWNNAENLFTGRRIIVVLQASSQGQNAPSLLRYCSVLRALFIFTWLNLNAY